MAATTINPYAIRFTCKIFHKYECLYKVKCLIKLIKYNMLQRSTLPGIVLCWRDVRPGLWKKKKNLLCSPNLLNNLRFFGQAQGTNLSQISSNDEQMENYRPFDIRNEIIHICKGMHFTTGEQVKNENLWVNWLCAKPQHDPPKKPTLLKAVYILSHDFLKLCVTLHYLQPHVSS